MWFEPVEGWTAKKTIVKNVYCDTESYEVIACPEFVDDRSKYKGYVTKVDLNELDITLARGCVPMHKGVRWKMVERIPEGRLRTYLNDLTPDEQNAIMICIIKNRRAEDAAEILHFSVSNIRRILRSAFDKIIEREKSVKRISLQLLEEIK